MNFLSWIVVGLIAGVLAKWIMPGKEQYGLLLTIIIGIVGAMVGGFLFGLFGGPVVTGINLTSIFVAVVGAVVLLAVYGFVTKRHAGHPTEPPAASV
jgi:uncharacterized membrane protein YeaQ/YmgE (transglycosylase-associated protein family)